MPGDTPAEYRTLTQAAGWIDLSSRGLLQLTGEDRARFLNGQTTNDAAALKPGQAVYSAFVNAKGKMRADGNILCFVDRFWIDVESGAIAESLAADLDKFIIADDVQVDNLGGRFARAALIGPKATDVLRSLGLDFPAGPNRFLPPAPGASLVFRRDFGPDTFFEIFSEAAIKPSGAVPISQETLEARRIELGIPRFGADMDESTLPPEAGIESRAVSYTKGCYIGQEVISRIKSVGHVNRRLARLKFAQNSGAVAPGSALLLDSAEAGRVTSCAEVPGKGWIGLGYVKRGISAGSGWLKGDGFEAIILEESPQG